MVTLNSEIRALGIPESFAFLNFVQIDCIANAYGKLLNLVFVSYPHLSISPAPDPLVPEGHHHPAMSIDFHNIFIPFDFNTISSYFDFQSAEVGKISQFLLSSNWSKTFDSINTDTAMCIFYNAIHASIFKHVPTAHYRSSIDDCICLNDNLNAIVQWTSTMGLSLNIQKCKDLCRFTDHALL